jgi:hypothetical protein
MAVPVTQFEKDIKKLCDEIDKNPGEEWKKRVKAMQAMTKTIEG